MEMISSNTLQDVSFLLCLAGKEVSLALGNASGSFMSVENIPLLWESSTGNQWRHAIPFSMLKLSEGIESGQNPVSLFSRCSSFMHWDFPISTCHGWTQALQDKISPFSGWKSSHECVKTVWEHPRSSLRSFCILRLMEKSLAIFSQLWIRFIDWFLRSAEVLYRLFSWLNAGGSRIQGV